VFSFGLFAVLYFNLIAEMVRMRIRPTFDAVDSVVYLLSLDYK